MNKVLNSESMKLTSKYGNREYYYNGNLVKDFHTGIDLISSPSVKDCIVTAFDDGIVTKVNKVGKQYGNACYVRIKHNNGWQTLYYHLKNKSICVNVGDTVKKGDAIGIIGCTGIATGIHLHFQIDKGSNATAIDPTEYVFNDKVLENTNSVNVKGNYVCLSDMYVRYGAGTNFAIKKYERLTPDGKRNARYQQNGKNAVYKEGTVFTALDIIVNQNGTWAKTPSGYVCIVGVSGQTYCKLV